MCKEEDNNERRNFLKFGLLGGITAAISGSAVALKVLPGDKKTDSGEKIKLLSPNGRLVEIDKSYINPHIPGIPQDVRKGASDRKFVMVIDLSKCKNAGKCQTACSKMHYLPSGRSYIKVNKMQDAETTAPYWMPTPCFHCDNPPCVKVCPVDATFKLSDGIVGIDNERCIGCRFCMVACPYSARVFNWSEEQFQLTKTEFEKTEHHQACNSHERGTVEKCDFCPGKAKNGELPDCVKACPNGVFYFGDENDDTVSNGDEVVRLSTLLKDKAGYRYLEELGTKPRVYYLPPANRMFPFEEVAKIKNQADDK